MKRLVVALLLAVTPANAGNMPDFDPVGICKRQSEAVNQGAWLTKACLDQEQRAYDSLKAIWPDLDSKTRAVCIAQSRAVDQGYWLLKACVDQELSAKRSLQDFQFKR